MRIEAFGGAVPEHAESNEVVEAELGLPANWIFERTGFRVRHRAGVGEAVSDLAVAAGREALDAVDRRIGLLVLATSTPDHTTPPTAPLVAHRLQLHNCGAVDVGAACAGFVYALLMTWGLARRLGDGALVIAANVLSQRIAPTDRRTRSVFSDGAGAIVLAPSEEDNLLAAAVTSCGSAYDAIGANAGGSRRPVTPEAVAHGEHYIRVNDGKRVTRSAVDTMATLGEQCLRSAGVSGQRVSWVPHQANLRIIRETGARLDIPAERWICYTDDFGNASSATIPVNLWRASRQGRLRRGDLLLLTTVGAGFTGAAALVRF